MASIAEHGGRLQIGWQLWEPMPGLMIEAKFHGVWVDARGNCRDVTPKSLPGIKQILFLPDPVRKYQGRQVDNVRVPLVDDPLITDFITTCEQFYEATNEGELANYHGPLRLTAEMRRLVEGRSQLGLQIAAKYYAPRR